MYQMNGEMHSLRSSLIFARFRLPFEECLTSFRFCSPADCGVFFLVFFVGMAFLLLCFTCPFSSLFNDTLLPIHKRDANKQTNKKRNISLKLIRSTPGQKMSGKVLKERL